MSEWWGRIQKFLREVRLEVKKVSHLNRKETMASTAVVLVAVILIAIFLGVVDLGLSRLVGYLIQLQ